MPRIPDDLETVPLRWALAFVYFQFGVLKFFPDLSTAEMLATQTILRLPLGVDAHTALYGLALFECTLGALFASPVSMRVVLPLFLVHMAGTFLPILVLPELAFRYAPFAPTFEGQYVLKNVVFVAAGWTLYRAEQRAERAAPEEAP